MTVWPEHIGGKNLLFVLGGFETVKLTIQMIPREINPSSVSAYEVLLKIAHSGSLQRFLN